MIPVIRYPEITKKHIHPGKTARQPGRVKVKQQHGDNRNGAQAIDVFSEVHLRKSSIG